MIIFEIGKKPRQSIPSDIRAQVIERQHNMCIVCGGPCAEIHHGKAFVRRLHQRGEDPNNLDELAGACKKCHKGRLDPRATRRGEDLRSVMRALGIPFLERVDKQGRPYIVHPKTPVV